MTTVQFISCPYLQVGLDEFFHADANINNMLIHTYIATGYHGKQEKLASILSVMFLSGILKWLACWPEPICFYCSVVYFFALVQQEYENELKAVTHGGICHNSEKFHLLLNCISPELLQLFIQVDLLFIDPWHLFEWRPDRVCEKIICNTLTKVLTESLTPKQVRSSLLW